MTTKQHQKGRTKPGGQEQKPKRLIPLRYKFGGVAVIVLAIAVHRETRISGGTLAALIAVAGTLAAVTITVLRIRRYAEHRSARHAHGFATRWEHHRHLSIHAARRRGRVTRPSLGNWRHADASEVGMTLGRRWFRRVIVPISHFVLMVAPPESWKTSLLSCIITDWPGPAFAASTRWNIVENTIGARMEHGPVWIGNPDRLVNVPSTIRWSPLSECENPSLAIERAGYLIEAGPKAEGTQNATFWNGKAFVLMRLMLHAAALDGADAATCHLWVSNPYLPRPLEVLDTHPHAATGWADELRSITAGGKDTVMVIAQHAADCLAWIADPEMARMACPDKDDTVLDLVQFVHGTGTIYMIGADRPKASLGPYFACLGAAIFETAKREGSKCPGGRLCPPVLLAPDEVTTICPFPLQRWSSESSGWGITVAAAAQNPAQIEDRWGDKQARSIWNNAGVKVIGGGFTHAEDLEAMSAMCGTYGRATNGDQDNSGDRAERILPVERLRTLRPPKGVIMLRTARPIIAVLSDIRRRKGHVPATFAEIVAPATPAADMPVPPSHLRVAA